MLGTHGGTKHLGDFGTPRELRKNPGTLGTPRTLRASRDIGEPRDLKSTLCFGRKRQKNNKKKYFETFREF